MNKFEMFCTLIVLLADIVAIFILGAGGTLSQTWISIVLFITGMLLGNTLFHLAFEDIAKNWINKGE